jgi:hypothetical protein
MTRDEVYEIINEERAYQDVLSADRTDGTDKTVGEYIVMLQYYLDKAVEMWTMKPGTLPAMDQVRKIAAIAVRCMEQHPTPRRCTESQTIQFAPPWDAANTGEGMTERALRYNDGKVPFELFSLWLNRGETRVWQYGTQLTQEKV